jgi:hypothetical protein
MGAEATCALRESGKRHTGRALLETDEIVFRGDDGYRLAAPLASLTNVRADGGALLLDTPSGAIVLELGAQSERWAERIRNPKTLLDKLDLKPTHRVAVLGFSDAGLVGRLAVRVAGVSARLGKGQHVVFLKADAPAALKKLPAIAKSIARDGAIWVVHPKGAAAKLKDTDIFAVAKKAGLTATKVARWSDTHTAEKLVIPVAKR